MTSHQGLVTPQDHRINPPRPLSTCTRTFSLAAMFNTLTRAQTVFGTFTTVLSVVAALIAFSDLFATRTPTAALVVNNVQV